MVDLTAISSAVSVFKTAVDIAKGIQSLNVSTEVRQKTSELLDAVVDARFKLIDASETQSTLLARIKELEEHITNFENWDSEKQRYQLKAIDTGAFAYMHKPGMENGEPAIWLCQTCFENRHISPLQFRAQDVGSGSRVGRAEKSRWGCNRCKAEVVVYYQRKPQNPWEPTPDNPEKAKSTQTPQINRGEGASWVSARTER